MSRRFMITAVAMVILGFATALTGFWLHALDPLASNVETAFAGTAMLFGFGGILVFFAGIVMDL